MRLLERNTDKQHDGRNKEKQIKEGEGTNVGNVEERRQRDYKPHSKWKRVGKREGRI